MRIVYADAYTLNPGDLNWAPIQLLGDVTFYDQTPPDQLLERINDADTILTNKVKLNRETIAQLPKPRCIGVTATGYDVVDVVVAREQGIVVINVKAYGPDSVA